DRLGELLRRHNHLSGGGNARQQAQDHEPKPFHFPSSGKGERWASMNRVTNGSAGLFLKSSKLPSCTMLPLWRRTILWPKKKASPRSWVTITTVLPREAKICLRSSWSSERIMGS